MKLIDKDVLVAEIERLKECNCKICAGDFDFLKKAYPERYYSTEIYNDILSFINTLEVKDVDLESLVRQVIDLYLESGKHYDNVIKEERKEHGGSDLAIKLLDGYIDAEELGIQYVLNKLNAQKGE